MGGSAKRYADELKIFPSAFVYSSFTLRSGEKLIYRVSQLGCHNMHQKREGDKCGSYIWGNTKERVTFQGVSWESVMVLSPQAAEDH